MLFRIVAILMCFLMMTGCTSSQVTTSVQTVVTLIDAVLPLVMKTAGPSLKISPELQKQILAYADSLDSAVALMSTELASTDTDQVKASKIVGYFSEAAVPHMPEGTPKEIASLVNQLSKAVGDVLLQFKSKTVSASRNGQISYDTKPLKTIAPDDIKKISDAAVKAAEQREKIRSLLK